MCPGTRRTDPGSRRRDRRASIGLANQHALHKRLKGPSEFSTDLSQNSNHFGINSSFVHAETRRVKRDHSVQLENRNLKPFEDAAHVALSSKHKYNMKESRLQPTTQPGRHPHPHTHTDTHPHTHAPTHPHTHPHARTGPKQTHPAREAKQKAEEQVPPGQGHQRKSLDIQSPSAVTIAVPAPTTGSHPR